MATFNLLHCLLHPTKPHGLLGYQDVIDTIAWGMKELGHEVKRSVNAVDPNAINILFGAQVLPVPTLETLPPNSIIYNFEQTRNVPLDQIRPEIRFIASRFRIWDYSPGNSEAWERMGAGDRVTTVPVGYAPILTRIEKPPLQDIDVLIYGSPNGKRLNAVHSLASAGLAVVFVCGVYGDGRDSLIARSKLVLNVNLYDRSRQFEIVRVSYLLANRKAVVSLLEDDTVIDEDIKTCIRFTDMEKLAANCRVLTENTAARDMMETQGFNVMASRDIRSILTKALAGL